MYLYKNLTSLSVGGAQCSYGAFLFVWLGGALSVVLEILKYTKKSDLCFFIFIVFFFYIYILWVISHFIKLTSEEKDPIHYVW